jgi:GT2 family glycosyltransferase/tRNA A-37 threonylcarbamoyl transferase component Bud32
VIVVAYNGAEILPACLESIPPGMERVVVDNGSTDGTPELVAQKFPETRLLRNPVNRGFAQAVNRGLEGGTSPYVCLLNSDARLEAASLSTLVGYMDAHPEVGVTAPQLYHEDGRRQHSFDNFPSLATVFLNKSLLRMLFPRRYPSKSQEFTEPREVESVIGACMILRRDLVGRIGGFDESYFLFLEETEWCLRARRSGSRIVFVPGARVVHLQGRTRDKVRFRARIEYTRSLFTFFRWNRRGSYPVLRALFPVRNFLELVFQTLTLFVPGVFRRWAETGAVLGWQLCLCPRSFGLSRAAEPRYLTLRDNVRVTEEHMEAFNEFEGKMRQTRVLKDLKHKRTLEYSAAGGKRYLVKMYKLDTLGRKLEAWLGGSRARHEFAMSIQLERRGIACVPIVAMKDSGNPRWVAVEKLEDWRELEEVLLSPSTPAPERRRLAFEYGKFARRLLDQGIWQYDFNPTNVLTREGRFRLIDFERLKVLERPVPRAQRIYLLAKMNRIRELSRTDRLRFLKGYRACDAPGTPPLGELARAILVRGLIQKEVDRDRQEDRCVSENRDFSSFTIGDWAGFYRKARPDRPDPGLRPEDLERFLKGGWPEGAYRTEATNQAIEAWKTAHRQAAAGAPLPLAVVHRKGSGSGTVVYSR